MAQNSTMETFLISHGDTAKLRALCATHDCDLLDLFQSLWAVVMGNVPVSKSSTIYLVSEGDEFENPSRQAGKTGQDTCFYISHPKTTSSFLSILDEINTNNKHRSSQTTSSNGGKVKSRGLTFSSKLSNGGKRSKTISEGDGKSLSSTHTIKINMSDGAAQPRIVMVTDIAKVEAEKLTSTFENLLQHVTVDASRKIGELLDLSNDMLLIEQEAVAQQDETSAAFWVAQLSNSNTSIFPALPVPKYTPIADKTLRRDILSLKIHSTNLRAAWALICAQYAGVQNITFGVSDLEDESSIVPVPVQVSLDFDMLASKFLQQIEEQATEMLPFQRSAALDRIGPLNAATELACTFQSLLVIRSQKDNVDVSSSPYALTVDCSLSSTGVSICASFDENVIAEAQMKRVLQQFEHVLERLGSEECKQMTIADLALINDHDRIELMTWNKTLPPTVNRCVHHVIEEQCKAQPNAPAVCAWDGEFTYSELDRLSTRLGHHLRSLGVRPEIFVPFCFEKSKWTVVTVMGIMKAGGVGVPLEPAHPIERRIAMVQDVGAMVTICSKLQFDNCSGLGKLVVIGEEEIQRMPNMPGPVCTDVRPHNAVYMIFTSGSTGKPKGVVWEHKTLSSSIAEHGKAFYFTRRPRVLQFAAHVFDISVADTFTTLTFGGCMCIPSDYDRMNNIVEFINRTKVDWCFFTPTFARLIKPDDIPGVKTVLLGGEKIGQDNVDNWRHKVQLIVVYGPAETCVYCSGNEVSIGNPKAESIGRTFGGNLWITEGDDPNRLVCIGAVGEIIIEGPILARGYLGDPQKTADSFIFDPEWSRDGTGRRRRFYRTGDLGKYSTDGTIAFVGRKDGQVKLRGQRMELGEVEHHLLHNELVKHAIAMVPTKGIAQGRLVAVITLQSIAPKGSKDLTIIPSAHRDEVAAQVTKIRDYLSAHLPVYMVPTIWLPMQDIPLNTSRKLDRPVVAQWVAEVSQQALDEVSHLLNNNKVEEITSSMEERLQRVWCRVLNLPTEKVGSNSSFLRLGGDSITAIQVTSRCRLENIDVTVQDILRYKTLSQIALRAKESDSKSVQVEEQIETSFELSPIQKMHVARFSNVENQFNQGFLLKVNKPMPVAKLRSAIEVVIGRHGMLRARFARSASNGEWTQLISADIKGSYKLTEHKISNLQQLEPVILATQTSFDITTGPLFGAAVINIPGEPQLLFLAVHHIVIDLVAWRIIMEDLEEVIMSGNLTAPRSLPFSSWIKMQSEYGQSSVTPKKALPVDIRIADFDYWGMSDRPNLTQDVIKRTFSVGKETTALILGACNETMSTEPNDLLLACVIHSFGQIFTDRDLPTVFNEGHGRELLSSPVDVSRTVGWFTVMSPISIEGADRNDLAQIIRETKDARHSIAKHGFDYFTSRFLTNAGKEAFAQHNDMEILFNYFGLYQQLERDDALFSQMPVNTVANMHHFSPKLKEWALFEIEVGVEDGELQFHFAHNRNMKHHTRILNWFDECKSTVEAVANVLHEMQPEFTLSDFPLLSLSYSGLENVVTTVLPQLGFAKHDVEDIYPCSPMQEGILISQTKDLSSYRVENTIKLTPNSGGSVDPSRLERAWRKVVDRNAILRSIFISSASDLNLYQQVVLVKYEPRIFHVKADTHEEALKAITDFTPIDYADASHSPHRFGICELKNGDVYARLEISHTLIDLTSTQILFEQISLAYDEILPAGPGPLYSDYISYIHNQPGEVALDYWKTYLESVKPCQFQLLNDGSIEVPVLNTLDIPSLEASAINAFCKANGVTMNNLISATWALLLQSYTGEDTVCFGYLTSGRDLPIRDIQHILGPFINMLVCRVDLELDGPIIKVLEKIQSDYVDGSDHQICSLSEIQHALDLGGVKLFNTAISLDKMPSQTFNEKRSISIEEIGLYDPTDIDLVLNVAYTETEIQASITYSTAWISDKNGLNVADNFSKILNSIIESTDKTVGEIDRLGQHNRDQIVAWNTNCPGHLDVCVHEEFHKQALLYPNSPAVSSWDGDLSYKELDDLSSRLSHYLVKLGIGLEIVVPLAFEKSKMVIISQLGILKAGGACLTMDMSHPVDRLEGLCKQVSAKLLLVAPSMVEKFKDVNIKKLIIDEKLVRSLPVQTKPACTTVRPNSMGFVVFTSGSTGQPKGIMLEHKTVCTSSRGHAKVFSVGPGSRCLQFSAFAFDVHISDIFTPLMYGACCCIPNERDRMDDLPGAINKLNANRAYITPTVATIFKPDDAPCLKMVALGGEPLTKENAKIWAGKVHLINVFGPSETSNWVSYLTVKPDTTQPSNIGPGNDVNVWLVDHITNTHLVPIGCVGEMFVEGPTLARGYYNDKEKTVASFIENPDWMPKDGTNNKRRVYGTGDLVRFNSDGTMLYVGRKDSQIKVHGQRIELGEIEYGIVECPEVKHVSVLLPKEGLCKGKLVAVVTLEGMPEMPGCNPLDIVPASYKAAIQSKITGVMDKLAVKLPAWMNPHFWAFVTSIPTSASGKLDRALIKGWVAAINEETLIKMSNITAELALESPTTPMELALRERWSQVLGIPTQQIGRDSSFLRLGGDSLLVMRLVTAARTHGIILSTAVVFGNPKLRDMALVSKASNTETVSTLTPFGLMEKETVDQIKTEAALKCKVSESAIQDMYPAAPLQEGLMALSLAQPGAFVAQNVYKLPQNLDMDKFRDAWHQVLEAHPILRTRIVNTDNMGTMQVVIEEKLRWESAVTLKTYLDDDRKAPILLGDSLARFAIIEGHFVMTAHHAVYDGWSLSALLEDVTRAYKQQRLEDRTPFKYFIQHIEEMDQKASQVFWESQLSNSNTSIFPQLPYPSYQPNAHKLLIEEIAMTKIPDSEITSSTILRAAWALVASQYMGADNVTFGLLLSGRNAALSGVTEMMGPTITTVPVQVGIDRTLLVSEFLNQIQNQATQMIPFEQIGLQRIRKFGGDAELACEFQTQLVIQPAATEQKGFEQLNIQQVNDPEDDRLTYLITLECVLISSGVIVNALFDEDIVLPSQMKRILQQFKHMTHQISSTEPDATIATIVNINAHDNREIMTWNRSNAPAADVCVHHSFEKQVALEPDAQAVNSWDGDMTYGELNKLADQLGSYLRHLGVRPEVYVAMCFEKTKWSLVATLAIMKAGGVCVPLDPTHPEDRKLAMVKEVDSTIVLASQAQAASCTGIAQKVVTISDATMDMLSVYSSSPVCEDVRPNHAVYVIFTSGSTGKPKAVVWEHRTLSSSLSKHRGALHFDQKRRLLQLASPVFDASVGETLCTLVYGSCICIPSDHDKLSKIVDYITSMRVDYIFLTPTFARLLNPDDVPTLKTLVLGGEAIGQDNIQKWGKRVQLINAYGPTECCILACTNEFSSSNQTPETIGSAGGGSIWIADSTNLNKLLPIGAIGEILIEGPTVAREYLHNKEKTAESFIQDLDWAEDYSQKRRFYRTGDLGKYNPDGSISFVGRKDNQIKLRGQRMELGEVEHHLSQSGPIQHVMVLIPSDGLYKGRLVAVFTLSTFGSPTNDNGKLQILAQKERKMVSSQVSQITKYIEDKLPPYMVPTEWVPIENMPLTSSGKLDRVSATLWLKKLSKDTLDAISTLILDGDDGVLMPTTQKEIDIQEVWCKVLNLSPSQVGTNVSFIKLGGDSISAIQVTSRCRSKNIDIRVQDILRYKTISGIADHAKIVKSSVVNTEEELDTEFELSPIQQLHLKQLQDVGPAKIHEHNFNQSFLLQSHKTIKMKDLEEAFEVLISQHSMLRARFTWSSDRQKWTQRITSEFRDAYLLRSHDVYDVKALEPIIMKTQAGMNIQSGPVFAADLFNLRTGNYKQLIFLTAHHLVIDLVSWRIIIHDLEEFLTTGTLSSVSKTLPFQRWVDMQVQYSKDVTVSNTLPFKVPEADFSYWGMADKKNLVQDHIERSFKIDREVSELLLGSANDQLNTEPLDLLISAVLYSFGQTFSDRQLPSVFNESHGREPWDSSIDLSRTVGWFTTLCPLAVDADKYDLLQIIREIKDRRRSIPQNGFSYFNARYSTADGAAASADPEMMELIFNYSGAYQQFERSDSLLSLTPADLIDLHEQSKQMEQSSLFSIGIAVVRGSLQCTFMYNRMMKHQDDISKWITNCEKAFTAITTKMTSKSPQLTLSDFPLLSINYSDLDTLSKSVLPQLGVRKITEVEDVYPCSPMQAGILVAQSKQAGDYKVESIFKITSSTKGNNVNIEKLEEAWQEVVARHAILRTVFIPGLSENSSFDQIVLKQHLPRTYRIEANDERDAIQKFQTYGSIDYSDFLPAHRLGFCQSTAGNVYCRLETSHALTDAISTQILIQEVGLAYDNKLSRKAGPLYSDYIAYIQKQTPGASLDYWKTHLAGVTMCHFPTVELSKQTELSRNISSINVEFPYADELHTFCLTHGFTVMNVTQAAWALVLQTYTGDDSTCFGYLASGRDMPIANVESSIGPLINMLVCRVDLASNRSIVDVLNQVQTNHIGSLPNQISSLAEVQHALGLAGKQLFNTGMSLQKKPKESTSGTSIVFEQLDGYDPSDFDIVVNAAYSDETFEATFNYVTSAMSERYATYIADTFNTIMKSIIDSPDQTVGELDRFGTENQQQVAEWNHALPPIVDECVHDRIANCARSNPNHPAICAWDGELTYQELDAHATRLAHHLCSLGVGPEVFVPFCFEKSMWTIVAILAIMKAGGACVPIEPAHPFERKMGMIEDVQATILLSSEQQTKLCANLVKTVVTVSAASLQNLPISPRAVLSDTRITSKAAYAIFTSGSTGKPKGVIWEHKNLNSGITYHGNGLQLGVRPRVLQFASHVFDASALEILTTLCFGGCICIPSDDDKMINVVLYINKFRVNWAFLTPTFARLINPDDVPTLKTLILGGEAIGQDNIDRWSSRLSLINGFGPSECSICCAANEIIPGTKSDNPDSIGLSVGSHIWITDIADFNKLMPIGALGEIVVEGPILARGYLNDEEKTAKAFVMDPEWSQIDGVDQGRRFYRTGDLARMCPDGTISFVGRKDNQVKVRGQRMEIGEVEHHLLSHGSVEHVLVMVPKSGLCEGRLTVALTISNYSATRNQSSINLCSASQKDLIADSISKVQEYLSEQLPTYMVPTVWLPVEEIPMTTTGKLDRVTVQGWVSDLSQDTLDEALQFITSSREVERPTTQVQKDIQEVWAEVLGIPVEKIGVNSSFINLGGDSILALQVVPKCREKRITLTVHDILRYKTISQIVLHTTTTTTTTTAVELPSISIYPPAHVHELPTPSINIMEEQTDVAFDLSPCQQIDIKRLSSGKHFNLSYLLKLNKTVIMEDLRFAINTVVGHHPMLRARFHLANKKWTQSISPETEKSYHLEMHDVLNLKTMDSIILQTQKSLDIRSGPLFAANLFTVNPGLEDYQLLFLTAHRLVIDAQSWQIVLEDIGQLLASKTMPLSKCLSFQTWIELQSKNSLKINPVSDMGPAEVRPPNFEFWGMSGQPLLRRDYSEKHFSLSEEQTEQLLGPCNKKLKTEPWDILLAATVFAFASNFDRQVPVIFSEESGRESRLNPVDLSRTVGCFATLSPLSVDLSDRNDIVQIIRQVKTTRSSVNKNGWSANHQDAMEILFDFSAVDHEVESTDTYFTRTSFMNLHEQSTRLEQPALFQISASVVNGSLKFSCAYNSLMKHQEQIGLWISTCNTALESMIEHLSNMETSNVLSDFPQLDLSHEQLETLLVAIKTQMPLSDSNIQDILPASDYQISSLANTLAKGHGDMNYLICEIGGVLNAPRLLDSCQGLIARHQVLRTGFVASQQHIFQVILSSGLFDFHQFTGDLHTAECPSPHIVKDSQESFTLGELHPRFMLIEHGTNHHSLVLRLPHALYDAISMGVLIEDLQSLYAGTSSSNNPNFGDFIAYKRANKVIAENYWRSYLEGSSVTSFQTRTKPHFSDCGFASVSRQITPTSLKSHGINTATLVKAAWAFVLSQASKKSDVVFGDLVNGRSAPVEGIERMTGVCLNMIPLRINLKNSKTVLNLLQEVQDRQLTSMPFEFLDTSDIINRCTNWTSWAGFGSTVNHTINALAQGPSAAADGITWNYNSHTRGGEISLIEIESHPNGADLDIEINFGDAIFPRDFVQELLDGLCDTIVKFSANVDAQLTTLVNESLSVSRTPASRSFGAIQTAPTTAPTIDEATKLVVHRVWDLTMKKSRHASRISVSTPFYNIWEQPIAAAQFVHQYKEEGIDLSMEDIFAAPTMAQQMALCATTST